MSAQDFPDLKTTWRCSHCGRLNSMIFDNVCPKCMDEALEEDQKKLDALMSPAERNNAAGGAT